MSNKRYTDLTELLDENQINKLTEETFRKSSVLKANIKKIASIAACLILTIGILNFNTVYAGVQNIFSYMFGEGLVENNNLDYFVLPQPVEFGDSENRFIIEFAYRNGNNITISFANTGAYASRGTALECKLEIDDKIYGESVGIARSKNSASVTVADVITDIDTHDKSSETARSEVEISFSEGNNAIEVQKINHKTELTFENVPKSNDITLIVNNTYKADIKLVEAEKIGDANALHSVSTPEYIITAIPLSPDNKRFGIDLKPLKYKNAKLVHKLCNGTVFVDEYGNEYRAEEIGIDSNAVKLSEQPKGRIVALKGAGIIMSAFSLDTGGVMRFTLPNPAPNQMIEINKNYDIYGLPFTVNRIKRDENGLLSVATNGKCNEYEIYDSGFSIVEDRDKARETGTCSYRENGYKIIEFTKGEQCTGDSITFELYIYEVRSSEPWEIRFE